jgi:hypothetical protein
MIIRWLPVVVTSLASMAAANAEDSTADRLNPPTGRIEMVLDSDMYNEVDDQKGASKRQARSGPNAWQKVIWDIATVAWLMEPERMVVSQVVPGPILTDEGTWKPGGRRHPVRVAVRLDRDRIFEVLFNRLGKKQARVADRLHNKYAKC